MKTDIELSKEHKLLDIEEIAKKANIDLKYLEKYGNHKGKINLAIQNELDSQNGKLILVTSTNPTPYGEGKTTMSIGINDALCRIGKKSILSLREPSLGPVFGIKGGATGGGKVQIVPMDDINLHFNGDFHAITSANNLLSSVIDNHIFHGNELEIDTNQIDFKRCLDLNDRALRNIEIACGKNETSRNDSFQITAASEIMAILCLSSDLEDLQKRLGNILIGYSKSGKPLFASHLKCEAAMTILLKDAIKPNLVSTLEDNPVLIHGGPFANIAHGCNSIIATKLALKLADYVVTEAGFGSDLGAEKFMDIKCRLASIAPDCVVINTTVRGLKYNSGDDNNDLVSLEKGLVNLEVHINNMQQYCNNIVVCINRFENDTDEEIELLEKYCQTKKIPSSVSTAYKDGSFGSIELVNTILEIIENNPNFKMLYDENLSIEEKINVISKEIYHAKEVEYSAEAKLEIEKINEIGLSNLPICVAKTQYSISDNSKLLGSPRDYNIHVSNIKVNSGAGFIVVYMGNIMTMPGLGKYPAYLKMSIDNEGNISGLS